MEVHVSFRHLQKSSAVIGRVENRARRLCDKFDAKGWVRAVFDRDGPGFRVDLTASMGGQNMTASGRDHDMYRLVDTAFDRLARQTARRLERTRHHAHQPSAAAA